MELEVEFNRDFEEGVKFTAELVDAAGNISPRCKLRVDQPPVFETQRRRYRLAARQPGLVALLGATAKLRVVEQGPRAEGADEDKSEVSVLCVARSRGDRRGVRGAIH